MNARNELNNLRSELRSIINELDGISNGLSNDFCGLSTRVYATKIKDVANEYRVYLSMLNSAYVIKKTDGGGVVR